MSAADANVLRFGEYELTLAPLALSRNGVSIRLRMQPLRLLALLAARPGKLVTHEDIRGALWNGRIVDFSGGVHVCIRQLRAALGDAAERPHYVETVPRQGYRFVARVECVPARAAAAAATVVPAPRPGGHVLLAAALVAFALATALRSDTRVAAEPGAARDAYLRGKYLLDEGGHANVRRSVRYFLDALAENSSHAPAHTALAQAYRVLGQRGASKLHASRAVSLAPDSAAAHVQMAISLMQNDWDWARAGRHVDRALALDPHSAVAHHVAASRLAILGDFPAALAAMQTALGLDPVSTLLRADYGWLLYLSGDNAAAIRRCREALDLDPEHVASLACLVRAAEATADPALATEAALTLMQLWGAGDAERAAIAALPAADAPRAYHEWRWRFFTTYPDQTVIFPDDLADASAALGNYEVAIAQLERAAEARAPSLPFMLTDPVFKPLRTDARFTALRARLNLPSDAT